jgi:hypothetical protein
MPCPNRNNILAMPKSTVATLDVDPNAAPARSIHKSAESILSY